MTGGGGGGQAEPAPVQQAAPMEQQQQQQEPVCALELKQLIECSQTQHDLTLCSGFNEALRQCRINNGMKPFKLSFAYDSQECHLE